MMWIKATAPNSMIGASKYRFVGAGSLKDHDYYRLRAAQEHEAAERAVHPAVRQVHLDLAKLYLSQSRQTLSLFGPDQG